MTLRIIYEHPPNARRLQGDGWRHSDVPAESGLCGPVAGDAAYPLPVRNTRFQHAGGAAAGAGNCDDQAHAQQDSRILFDAAMRDGRQGKDIVIFGTDNFSVPTDYPRAVLIRRHQLGQAPR